MAAPDFAFGETTAAEDGWTVQVRVPDGCRYFEGHFPAQPILPAIAHLALVDQVCRQVAEDDGLLCDIHSIRLRQPVLPGSVLTVSISKPSGDRLRFVVKNGDNVSSQGTLGRAPVSA